LIAIFVSLTNQVCWTVIEWLLFNAKWTTFQPYHGEDKLRLLRLSTCLVGF
jgi:hypothetical protein